MHQQRAVYRYDYEGVETTPPGYHQPHHQYRPPPHRDRSKSKSRYICIGLVFMIFGLILYFAGGYLFISSYTGKYPILDMPVESFPKGLYWYIGPGLFFVGLVVFVVALATFCRGIPSCWGPR